MNLEALMVARAQEQAASGSWKFEEPAGPRKKRRMKPGSKRGGRTITCTCGGCHKCKNRLAMRERRAGVARPKAACGFCGKGLRHGNHTGWCGTCRQKRPATFRRYAAQRFSHGGGI